MDTLGLPEVILVTGANVQDRDGGRRLLDAAATQCPRLQHGWMDGAYEAVVGYATTLRDWVWEVVKRPKDQTGFVLLPKRWVVERTFGWFAHYRRLSKDVEVLAETQTSMLYAALIHLLARRQAA